MTRWSARLVAAFALVVLGGASAFAQGVGQARVFVEFRAGQKAPVKAALQAAGGQIHYEFDSLSAIAVTLPEAALPGIERNPNVVLVEDDPPRYPFGEVTPYGVPMVQAPAVWGTATGKDITIGVIDSGVHGGHADFSGANLDGDFGDGCGHGTHVAGTILATHGNNVGVVGVAPEARVYAVRVFGSDCSWTYASGLINAVQVAVNNGARVISMSLGGGIKSRTEDNAFKQFYASGALSIAAAGNNGTTQNSYPASYSSVVSVAAIDQNKVVADFSQKNGQVELAAPGVGVLSTVPFTTPSVVAGAVTYQAGAIEFAATGAATAELVNGGLATSPNSSWAGKVVLVERGSNSFYDKVANVQSSGGVAAIIYNNVAGGFSGTLGTGNASIIPAVSVTRENGLALLAKLGTSDTSVTVDSPPPGPGSGYAYYDGTSMATPHVSAVAALVWSAFPCASNDQLRTALTSTAEDLGPAGRDTAYGFGLVRAAAALNYLSGLGLACSGSGGGGGGGGGSGDTTPPVISNVESIITNAKNGSFEIRWTTDEPATSDVSIAGSWYTNATLTTSHRWSFRGAKGATYEYSVRSTDAAGNPATSSPHTHQN